MVHFQKTEKPSTFQVEVILRLTFCQDPDVVRGRHTSFTALLIKAQFSVTKPSIKNFPIKIKVGQPVVTFGFLVASLTLC